MQDSITRFNRRQVIGAAGALTAGVASSMLPRLSQAAGNEILIGQSVHTTGPLSVTMPPVLKGQDMAIADINRKGGIGGRKIKLITLDDAYDPKKCVANVNQLIDEHKVVALYGLGSTANVGAALPVLAEKKVPLVGVYTGSPVLRAKQHPYFFTTMASYRDEVVQMMRNLVTLQRGQIGLVYQNSPFGQLMRPVCEEVAKELGATLVAKEALEANGSNAQAVANAVAAAKAQSIIFMSFGPSLIPFAKAAKASASVPIYCISISNSQTILGELGDEARGLAFTNIIPYPWRATTGIARDYNAAMTAAKLPVDYDHFFGYLNLRVLIEGIRRAGKNVTPQGIVAGMESMTKTDVGGYPVDYSASNHHGSKLVEITIVGPGGRYLR